MKKVFLVFVALAVSFSIVSCGGLESKAKKQMKETMMEMAKNPDTFKMINVKTLINNDSLCVIHFVTKGQNGFGGWSTSRIEYIFIKRKRPKDSDYKYKECIVDLDDCNGEEMKPFSVIDESKIEESDYKKVEHDYKCDREEAKKIIFYMLAVVDCDMFGREVDEEQ